MSWAALPPRRRAALRAAVLERDGWTCRLRLAGCTLTAEVADHIRPRETHGDGPDNLQAACTSCNLAKGRPGGGDPDPRPSRWM